MPFSETGSPYSSNARIHVGIHDDLAADVTLVEDTISVTLRQLIVPTRVLLLAVHGTAGAAGPEAVRRERGS